MRLGAGIARVRDLLDANVRVGLGVDGSASNERGDLFLEVKQALLVARAHGGPHVPVAVFATRARRDGHVPGVRMDVPPRDRVHPLSVARRDVDAEVKRRE